MMNETASHEEVDPAESRRKVTSTLKRLSRTGALPTLPSVASAALGIARDPEADVKELCDIVRTDVGLSARVLRIANSAALARRRAARELSEAVLTIGLRKACDVLVAACARQLYDVSSPQAAKLWEHSLAAAVAAEEIARRTRLVDAQRAFLPGLFHDVGRIAFFLADDVGLAALDRMVDGREGTRCMLENEWYGFDHTEVAACLVEEWGLAMEQSDAIRWHHAPAKAGAAEGFARVLNAADGVAYAIGMGTDLWVPEEVDFAGLVADESEAEELVEVVRGKVAELREAIG